jgi:hypothetical protein
MVQQGHVPHDIALLAGMRIDRLSKPQPQGNPNQPTVLEKTFAPQQQMMPQSLAQMQQPQMPMQQAPQMPPQMQQAPVQAADGGLMQLPVGDMFNEASYAGGGIIAFDEGGGVPSFALGGEPGFSPDGFFNFRKSVDPRVTELARTLGITEAKAAELIKQKSQQETDVITSQALVNPKKVDPAKVDPAKADPAKVDQDLNSAAAALDGNKKAAAGNPYQNAGSFGQFKEFGYKPKQIDETIYDDRLNDKPTYEGIEKEQAARREKAGINDTLFQKQRDELMKEKDGLTGLKDKALWESMAIAGFGMAAGNSQYGIQNLAEGMGLGVKNLVQSRKDIRAEEKALRRETSEIDRAEQARKEARLAGDTARFDVKDAQYKELVNKKQDRIDNNINTLNDAEKTNKKMVWDANLKQWEVGTEQAGLNKRSQIQADMYSKLLGNDVKAGGFDAQREKDRAEYITNALKDYPGKSFLARYGTDLTEKDLVNIPEKQRESYIKARQKYELLKADAEKKFPTLNLPSRLPGQSGTGIIDFNSLK